MRNLACLECGDSFTTAPGRAGGGVRKFCTRTCQNKHNNRRNKAGRDAGAYVRKYGITLEERDSMREQQDYRCAICNRHEDEIGVLRVDHCHETGMVRAMLCHGCNVSLGHFGDNVETLMNAAAYLMQYTNVLRVGE